MRVHFGLIIILATSACGSEDKGSSSSSSNACAGSVVLGSWSGTTAGQPDTLTFGPDCRGSSTWCQSTFSYPNVTASPGEAKITYDKSNGQPGCATVKSKSVAVDCTFSVSGSTLTTTCGDFASPQTWQKQ